MVESSRVIAHVELGLAPLRRELEQKVGPRVAEARGASLGLAGHVNYHVDRGPFALSIEDEALVVATELTAHAEVCRRGRCYAACDPTVRVRFEQPLRLTAEYRFAPSRVQSTFIRGCRVRALGGFLTIDVTGTLEAELAARLREVQRQVERELPDLRPHAERAWGEITRVRRFPLGCADLQPRGFVQGPIEATGDQVRLRLALAAAPELRTQCDETASAAPLPPLAHEPDLPADADLLLGFALPIDRFASALEGIPEQDVGGARARVKRANVTQRGERVHAELSLDGELCGELALTATPRWRAGGRSLELTAPTLSPEDTRRLEAAGLVPARVASTLVAAPQLTLPFAVDGLVTLLPTLASAASNDRVTVRAAVTSATPATVAVRDEELVARARVRGHVELRPKP